jgi:hypothetical protein
MEVKDQEPVEEEKKEVEEEQKTVEEPVEEEKKEVEEPLNLASLTVTELITKVLVTDELKNKLSIKLNKEAHDVIAKLLFNSPECFNEIDLTLSQIIKDNKIDSNDIPNLLILIQKIYELVYKLKTVKLDKKQRIEISASILKFVIHTLVEERKIKIDESEKVLVLALVDKLIDSCISLLDLTLVQLSKKGCLKSIFGKK